LNVFEGYFPKIVPSGKHGSGKGAAALAWVMARLGKFAYCQCPGRQDPDNSGITDCSGLMYAAYMATSGTFVGTWTGELPVDFHAITIMSPGRNWDRSAAVWW